MPQQTSPEFVFVPFDKHVEWFRTTLLVFRHPFAVFAERVAVANEAREL